MLSAFPARADQGVTTIAPGASYQQIYQPEGPWAINVVAAEVSQQYLELHALLGGGSTVGRQALSGMLAGQASEKLIPVAGVNGDYFAMAGGAFTTIPLGLQVESGELVTFPDPARSVFYVLADATLRRLRRPSEAGLWSPAKEGAYSAEVASATKAGSDTSLRSASATAHIGRFRADAWLVGPEKLLYPLAGINRPPERGELVLFTSRFGRETRGYEGVTQIVMADLSGPVKTKGEVSATIGSVSVGASQPIPADGAVLVANGVAAYALRGLKAGDTVRLQIALDPDVGEMRMAVSGGPRLVREGRVSVESRGERFADSFAARRHPRTGVGLRQGAVVLVTVDGRQPGYSEGMSLAEFAQVLVNLGCTDAMNLDGGGSTTMVVRSQVVNSPSEGRERKVANALALFSTAPATGKAVRLAVEPAEANVLSGERLPLAARGLDEYYNPVGLDPKTVTWTTGSLGRMDEQGSFVAAQVTVPTAGLVTARLSAGPEGTAQVGGEMTASAVVCVLPSPTRLVVTPDRVSLAPKATHQFSVRAFDEDNRPIRLRSDRVTWSCDPATAGATVDRSGLFRAPAGRAELTVTAKVGDVSAKAQVLVAAATTVIADFERAAAGRWSYASAPAGLPGSVAVTEDPLTKGNHCLELRYDLSPPVGQVSNLPSLTRAAEAVANLPLPDTRTISMRVLGDGQGAWLRARLRDAAERRFMVDLATHLDWSGRWRTLTAWLPDDSAPPLILEAVYVTAYRPDQRPAGTIYLDDIAVEPAAEGAATPAAEPPGPAAAGEGKETSMDDLPTYICRRTPEPVMVDGRLSEQVWSRAVPVGDFRSTDGRGEPQLPTEVKLCWDDTNLYLAFVAIDTDIWGTMRKRDEPIYEEEVVEAFLSSGGDVTRYFEFEWSPHSTIFDAKIECPEWGDRSRMVADLSWDCRGLQSAVGVVGTLDQRGDIDQRWTVEAALPFAEIGRDGRAPAEGERWRANFYRADRAGDGEFSCWSPTLSRDFHVPARFGNLVFSQENW